MGREAGSRPRDGGGRPGRLTKRPGVGRMPEGSRGAGRLSEQGSLSLWEELGYQAGYQGRDAER